MKAALNLFHVIKAMNISYPSYGKIYGEILFHILFQVTFQQPNVGIICLHQHDLTL